MYGQDGRDEKKLDKKYMVFDFGFFQQLTHREFIDTLQNKISSFVQQLNETKQNEGKSLLYMLLHYFYNLVYLFLIFLLESSIHTERHDLKSFKIACIKTTDPSIDIILTLEVKINKNIQTISFPNNNNSILCKNHICLAAL
jgi:hypothetical protein